MNTRKRTLITAVLATAVMFIGNSLVGCVFPRHIDEVKYEISKVQAQNEETQRSVARLDSVITEGEQSNARLRNDVSSTVSQLQRQIASLLENYNDLMQKLDEMSRRKGVILSSPGSQTRPSTTTTTEPSTKTTVKPPPPVVATPSIDCDAAYDEAFILVRRGEYETALAGFNEFIKECSEHESVENAYYWIGECYYSMEKYVEAVSQFDLLLTQYKSSPNLGRAMYKLARSYQELGKTKQASELFQKLVDEQAGTLEAEQAKERLKELK